VSVSNATRATSRSIREEARERGQGIPPEHHIFQIDAKLLRRFGARARVLEPGPAKKVSSGVTRARRSPQGALRSSCFVVPFASTVVIDARTSFPFWIAMCVHSRAPRAP